MRLFRNYYVCPECSEEWNDEWSCTCDDTCPNCGCRNISPTESEDVENEVELAGEPRPTVNIPAKGYAGFAAVFDRVALECPALPGEPEATLPYNQLSLFGDDHAR